MPSLSKLEELWATCELTSDPVYLKQIEYVCLVADSNKLLYQAVELETGVPWYVVAAIHFREANQGFNQHFHNGDPLSERTIHVPKGRPMEGEPPFTWAESAADALRTQAIPKDWDIITCLDFMERYNGLGYRRQGINSPYLWNYTNQYTSGLFTADGKLDPDRVEKRPGCVAILKTLNQKGTVINGVDSRVVSSLH